MHLLLCLNIDTCQFYSVIHSSNLQWYTDGMKLFAYRHNGSLQLYSIQKKNNYKENNNYCSKVVLFQCYNRNDTFLLVRSARRRWQKTTITWAITEAPSRTPSAEKIIEEAFDKWAAVIPLKFVKVSHQQVSALIERYLGYFHQLTLQISSCQRFYSHNSPTFELYSRKRIMTLSAPLIRLEKLYISMIQRIGLSREVEVGVYSVRYFDIQTVFRLFGNFFDFESNILYASRMRSTQLLYND